MTGTQEPRNPGTQEPRNRELSLITTSWPTPRGERWSYELLDHGAIVESGSGFKNEAAAHYAGVCEGAHRLHQPQTTNHKLRNSGTQQ